MECEKKREVKDHAKDFGLSKKKDGLKEGAKVEKLLEEPVLVRKVRNSIFLL